jgi:hypothetical protein
MANIEVSAAIDNLLKSTPSTTVTTIAALKVLGAATTGDASIVNADISATAAINVSKLTGVQASLVSGTNIKSVNGTTLLGSGDVAVTGSDVINVTAAPYNAVDDGRLIDTFLNTSGNPTQGASMTSGSATVTVTGGTFAAGDVGKYICIQGVGTLPTGTITATAGVITAVTLSTTGSVGAYPASTTIDFEVESLGSANPPTSEPIASASQASNVVTLVFSSPHGFNTGDLIDVTGITGSPSPNGRYTVTSTPLVTTLTYALSGSAGTYTVSSATANGVAIAGANGVLRMTTDANGQALALTILTAGTLYANPALVFPETGLIGTITAFTNSTTVTISRVAPSTFTNKPCFFGTDNTAAIQAALDAALASTTIKTVYIPTGIFLCNIRTYADINLIGAGGGIGLANNLTFAQQIVASRAQENPTVLMPAVGYKPVIYATNGGGVISRMLIQGASSLMNNTGFKLGTSYGTGFVSQGVNLNQLNFSGFKYAVALARISTPILNNITGSYCRIAFYLTQPDENRYTDQISITGASFNFVKDYMIYSSGSKSITVSTSECSNCGRIARLKNGAKLVVNGFNIENSPLNFPNTATTNVDGDLFEVVGGAHLVLSAVRLANPSGWTNGAVIKEDLNRVNYAGLISVMSSDSGGSGLYRVNGSKYPNLLPKGAIISRFNSDFTTKIMSEISTRAYAGAGKMGRYKSWDEYFPTNPPSNKMVTAASLTTNVVTLTTSIVHGMSAGMQVIVDGVGFTTVNPNGTFIVVSAPTTTTLTYAVTGTAETYTVTGRSFVTVEGLGYQNGFCVTNIGATNIVRDRANGAFHLKSLNTAASTGFRIAQEYESISSGTPNWELKFDVQTETTIYTPNVRFGLYDLSSATLNPNNGIGILISNTTDLVDPNIFLELRVSGSTTFTQDTGIKYLTAGGSASNTRKILVLTRIGNQITLTVHGAQESGYVPYAQYVWNQTIANPSLYYSPAIYLGNNTTKANWQEMYVNSIKYQELNADLM